MSCNWSFANWLKRKRPKSTHHRRSFGRITHLLEDRVVPSFMLRFEQPTFAAVTISDNAPGDNNAAVGTITFLGTYGTFNLNVTSVLSKPGLGGPGLAEIDFSTFLLSSPSGGSLTATAVDTDFTDPPQASNPLTFDTFIGGTLNAGPGSSVLFQSWANDANLSPLSGPVTTIPAGSTTGGPLGPFTAKAYSGTATTTFNRGPGPFSMFCQSTVTMVGTGSGGFDADMLIRGTPPPPVAALGDFVWEDLNANGLQDAGEPGIAGVGVDLLDSTGTTVLATTTTDVNGLYLFGNLTPGGYVVQFPDLAIAGYTRTGADVGGNDGIDSDANTTTGKTGVYTLIGGQTDLTVDSGYYKPAALGDFVWEDTNANGVQDSGEVGIGGVLVTLTGTDGLGNSVNQTTTTDAAGLYLFSNLVPGTYSVTFPALAGYVRTAQDQGGNDATDSDADTVTGQTGNYTLVSGQTDLTVDAGYYKPAALGDFVWEDLNANGVQDAGEPGIAGVTVTLTGTDGLGNPVNQVTATDASGLYLFPNLVPGTYSVNFAPVAGYVRSAKDQGGNDAIDSDADSLTGQTGNYTLVSGQTDLTVDAGLYRTAAVGDFVWEDTNANGKQDGGEPGIPGVTVRLYDCVGNTLVATTTTDAAGKYLFSGLTPGTYHVEFVAPGGYVYTAQDAGGNDAVDSDANPATGQTVCFPLTSGQTDLTWDAGLYQLAALGDFVWNDLNNNGLQDAGEPGIPNVTVTLTGTDGLGNAVSKTTTTDASGLYLFPNLVPGTYAVTFPVLAGFIRVPANVGSNDAVDSDADTTTGKTGFYTLVSGQTDLTVDAGYCVPAPDGDVEIEKFVSPVTNPGGGGEGLTPGYWKQSHHFDDWVNYTQSQLYNTVFGVSDSPTLTLLGALQRGGGGVNALGRHAVAALLNASHPNISYLYSVSEIISMVQQAFANGTFEATKNLFEAQNTLGANLNSGGGGGGGPVFGPGIDADTPPGLVVATGSLVGFTYYVTNPGPVPLANVVVTDDNETPGNPADDFQPAPVLVGGFNVGDDDQDGLLDPGEEWLFRSNTVTVTAGQHTNIGTVVGTPVGGGSPVTDSDPANWFGQAGVAGLGDFVWEDCDGDGVQDAGEAGIPGVTVRLLDAAGTTTLATTATDASGNYQFTGLAPGSYVVQFVAPSGYVFTAPFRGADPAKDSNADPTTGKSGVVALAAGQNNPTVDAGLYRPGEINGFVYVDADDDGAVDPTEPGIPDVAVTLHGTDVNGSPFTQSTTTDAFGFYRFNNLRPGTYKVTEAQPSGFTDGKDTAGSLGGTVTNDSIANIVVPCGAVGDNYNFGERNGSSGPSLTAGQTATIGFWHNKNGKNLIKGLNGGPTSTNLGNWLASSFPNLYGPTTGTNNMTGKTNTQVAAYFKTLFNVSGQKTEAQVLATALAVYVTNSSLAGGNSAAGYGFIVNANGTGASTFNVGSNGSAFGVANNTTLTILQILQAVNAQAVNGVLYAGNTSKRNMANVVFSAINEEGDIG